MKRKIDEVLKEYYRGFPQPPDNGGMDKILAQISANPQKNECIPRMSFFEFTVSQIRFMKRGICIMQIILLAMCFWGLWSFDDDLWKLVWISSVLPVLIMGAMWEFSKSFSGHMPELELSAKYTMQQVQLARVLAPGLLNFAEISTVFICSELKIDTFSFILAVYMSVPFLLTVFLCLLVVNRISGKECSFMIAVIGIGVSGGTGCLAFGYPQIYKESMRIYWCLLAAFFVVAAPAEIARIMRECDKKSDGIKGYSA